MVSIFKKSLITLLLCLTFIIFKANTSLSQSEGSRLAFGFTAGGVKYWGEFTDNQYWLAGDLFLRYNIISRLSLTGTFGLAQMRWKIDPAVIEKYPGYFGNDAVLGDRYPGVNPITGATIQSKNQTRLTTYELTLSYNFFPSQKFVPMIFGGIGLLNFEPRAGDVGGFGPLPNNSKEIYDKQILAIPLGAGFEFYLTDNLVLNGKGTLRLTNTDYLDDLSGTQTEGANWDINADKKNDLFLTFGLGLSYYIFGDADYDKDGLSNSRERELGTDPYNPDTDGDGLLDGEEVYVYYTNPLKVDTDDDGLTDYDEIFTYKTSPVRADTDNDGLSDGEEIARKTDPKKPDSDGDGLLDGDEVKKFQTDPLNPDSDGDSLSDGDEVFKYNTNPKSKDTDGDGLSDGDEVFKHKSNPANPDSDGDGINDGLEVLQYKTDPLNPDTDGDGLSDGEEILTHKTDPLNSDTDGDGLSDGDEVNKYKTNPLLADTDKDGLSDGDEVNKYKSDPLNPDTDGDSLKDGEEVHRYKTDPLNPDTDGDKLSDGNEVFETKTDPLNPDTDGDGLSDGEDDCPLTPGVASDEKGRNGCPAAPKIGTKTDFPDILFIVNTDNFNYEEPGTAPSLAKLLDYVNQCPGLQIRIEGHASAEGNAKRNQELSELRAKKVRLWLIEQGVNADRIRGAIGFGSQQQKVSEPTGAELKSISKDDLEAIRKQNRRITIEVVRSCDEVK